MWKVPEELRKYRVFRLRWHIQLKEALILYPIDLGVRNSLDQRLEPIKRHTYIQLSSWSWHFLETSFRSLIVGNLQDEQRTGFSAITDDDDHISVCKLNQLQAFQNVNLQSFGNRICVSSPFSLLITSVFSRLSRSWIWIKICLNVSIQSSCILARRITCSSRDRCQNSSV